MTNFFITIIWLRNHNAVVQDLFLINRLHVFASVLSLGKLNEMVAISNLTYLDVVHFLPLGIACMFNVVQYKLLYEEQ